MSEIVIKYDEYYDKWMEAIKQALINRDIFYTDQLIIDICESIKKSIDTYLKSIKYHPQKYLSYRVNLIKRLAAKGLGLSIRSNYLLWKYLEYFNDLKDFSNCFDVEIIVIDSKKAFVDCKIVGVNKTLEIETNLPRSDLYKDIFKKITELSLNAQNNPNMSQDIKDIIYILEYLVIRGEL